MAVTAAQLPPRRLLSTSRSEPYGTETPPVRMLVAQAVEAWLARRYALGTINHRTRTLYESRLSAFVTMYGQRDVSSIGRSDVQSWQASIGELGSATRRLYVSAMKQWLTWCVDEGLIDGDPVTWLVRVREPRRVPRARTGEEMERIWEACQNQRERVIVALMVQMGLRACEVARADLADWDQRGGILLVRGKGGHQRVLPVPKAAAAELEAYRSGLPLSGALICDRYSRHGLDRTTVSSIVTEVLVRAGVKRAFGDGVTPHSLRHTAASDVLDRCHDVRTVQQMLGHQSLATTQIYLRRASLDQLREAMEGRDYAV